MVMRMRVRPRILLAQESDGRRRCSGSSSTLSADICVWVSVRRRLSIWRKFKAQDDCPSFGRIAEQNRSLSCRYKGDIEPFQLNFVNRI